MLTEEDIDKWNERLAKIGFLISIIYKVGGKIEFTEAQDQEPSRNENGWFVSTEMNATLPYPIWNRKLTDEEVKKISYQQEYQFFIKKNEWDLFRYVLDKRLSVNFIIRGETLTVDYTHQDKDLIEITHIVDEMIDDEKWSRYDVKVDGRILDCMFIINTIDTTIKILRKGAYYKKDDKILTNSKFKIGDIVDCNEPDFHDTYLINDITYIIGTDSWVYEAVKFTSLKNCISLEDSISFLEHNLRLNKAHDRDRKLDKLLD